MGIRGCVWTESIWEIVLVDKVSSTLTSPHKPISEDILAKSCFAAKCFTTPPSHRKIIHLDPLSDSHLCFSYIWSIIFDTQTHFTVRAVLNKQEHSIAQKSM